MLGALTRYIYFVCGSLRLLPSCLLYSLFVEQLEEYVCSNWCTLSDILQTHLKALRRIYEYSLQLSINLLCSSSVISVFSDDYDDCLIESMLSV